MKTRTVKADQNQERDSVWNIGVAKDFGVKHNRHSTASIISNTSAILKNITQCCFIVVFPAQRNRHWKAQSASLSFTKILLFFLSLNSVQYIVLRVFLSIVLWISWSFFFALNHYLLKRENKVFGNSRPLSFSISHFPILEGALSFLSRSLYPSFSISVSLLSNSYLTLNLISLFLSLICLINTYLIEQSVGTV